MKRLFELPFHGVSGKCLDRPQLSIERDGNSDEVVVRSQKGGTTSFAVSVDDLRQAAAILNASPEALNLVAHIRRHFHGRDAEISELLETSSSLYRE